MHLSRHVGTYTEQLIKRMLNAGRLGSGRNRRPFTRPALNMEQYDLQVMISTRPACPQPSIKEKRLINGKWTRDYPSA